jgi:uncharacterized lipoprotein YddW (UPF0748 family)
MLRRLLLTSLAALGGLSAFSSSSLLAADPAPAAPAATPATAAPEVRGTWLTTTANNAISNPATTADTMRELRDIGLNTVYLECWKNGYTEFPSDTMQKFIGVPMKINDTPARYQRDLLFETVTEAHRNGLVAIGWFEYGFMAAHKDTKNELRAKGEKEGWLLQDPRGNLIAKDSFVWMNPLHPVPQQLLIDIVTEAVRKYDLDGVQLDDRISMPTELGYDEYSSELYAKEHDGLEPPSDPKDEEFLKWRAGKLSAYAKRFAAAVHAVNPKCIVSVSPAPYPWCYEEYACDWPTWTKYTGAERWDEYIPQNYRFTYRRTKASIEEGLKVIGDRRSDLLAGIRVVGDGPDLKESDLIRTIEYTRKAKLGGHVLWYSRGVLDVYPTQLRKFYNVAQFGQAPHPTLGATWRTPAIAAQKDSAGKWTATLPADGAYQVIAKRGASWERVGFYDFKAGPNTLTPPQPDDIKQLELLVYRGTR